MHSNRAAFFGVLLLFSFALTASASGQSLFGKPKTSSVSVSAGWLTAEGTTGYGGDIDLAIAGRIDLGVAGAVTSKRSGRSQNTGDSWSLYVREYPLRYTRARHFEFAAYLQQSYTGKTSRISRFAGIGAERDHLYLGVGMALGYCEKSAKLFFTAAYHSPTKAHAGSTADFWTYGVSVGPQSQRRSLLVDVEVTSTGHRSVGSISLGVIFRL